MIDRTYCKAADLFPVKHTYDHSEIRSGPKELKLGPTEVRLGHKDVRSCPKSGSKCVFKT